MNKDLAGALELVNRLKAEADDITDADIGVFPPYAYLAPVAQMLKGSRVIVGAQNMHPEPKGAFTGEISAPMILDVGATHVIIGHSERRQLFGETDEGVNAKLKAALGCRLNPLVCVGETLEQRRAGSTEEVLMGQVEAALSGLSPEEVEKVVLAYEPIWAIGTGETATPDQAQQAHAFIRSVLTRKAGSNVAARVRIQYGGSVKPKNAADLLHQEDIDGALVGGASLDAESFIAIIKAREA